jgi:hypothetical protein
MMKNLVAPVLAAIGAALVTVLLAEALRDGAPREAAGSPPVAAPRAAAAPEKDGERPSAALVPVASPETDLRMSALEARIDSLEARLAAALDRRPVPAEEVAKRPNEAVPLAAPEARDFEMDVLEEDRQQRETERAQRRLELLEERARVRADELSEELGLALRERESLYGVLVEESTRRTALFESLRDGEMPVDGRDEIRERFRAIDEWKSTELTAKLGSDVATKVLESERGGFGGFGRGHRGRRDGGGDGFPRD